MNKELTSENRDVINEFHVVQDETPEIYGLGTCNDKDNNDVVVGCIWPYQPKAEQEDSENYTF